jgi:hypothetical protein
MTNATSEHFLIKPSTTHLQQHLPLVKMMVPSPSFPVNVFQGVHVPESHTLGLFIKTERMLAGLRLKSISLKLRYVAYIHTHFMAGLYLGEMLTGFSPYYTRFQMELVTSLNLVNGL